MPIEKPDANKSAAREALYKAIAESAAAQMEHPLTNAGALKDLAEAYAWVSATAQPH